eukprot:s325_g21.t1
MKTKFDKAIQREIENNIESGAYEILDRKTSEEIRRTKPDKIVQSRYVLTEKPIEIEDIDKAAADGVLLCRDGDSSKKAKARHVTKGFSEENSEYLEVTTPQVGRETVLFTLQILASLQWLPGYLDFTQAFHSGDALQREIFAELPHEGLPGCHPRQLLRLRKCCYGLLDGPFQWFNGSETRPDLAGRIAFLQHSMPTPYIQDLLEANALAREALKTPEVGIRIQPIPFERLRIGTVTDASWRNVKSPESDAPEKDFWLEKADCWIRVHIQPRRILFHPGSAPGGPDLYEFQNDRVTVYDDNQKEDAWNHRDSQHPIGDRPWTGQTTFFGKNAEKGKKETINEKVLQNQRLASQGGYITFLYDSNGD